MIILENKSGTTFIQKGKEKRLGSATITSRRQYRTPTGRGKRHKPSRAKQTNARRAHGPALSSPSKVIAMLKGLKNTSTKCKARLNLNRIVELTPKLHE